MKKILTILTISFFLLNCSKKEVEPSLFDQIKGKYEGIEMELNGLSVALPNTYQNMHGKAEIYRNAEGKNVLYINLVVDNAGIDQEGTFDDLVKTQGKIIIFKYDNLEAYVEGTYLYFIEYSELGVSKIKYRKINN